VTTPCRALAGVLMAVAFASSAACFARGSGTRPIPHVRVFATASLTDSLPAITEEFEESANVAVELSFGASSALAQQVKDGADADVLITADQRTMDTIRASDLVDGDTPVIARNRLAILVERGNPLDITALPDLAREGVVTVLCAPEAPCGALARALLAEAGVNFTPASLEENVKGVMAKVTLGEADAGIVYETDVRAAGSAEGVTIPEAADARFEAVYPAAVIRSSTARAAARDFVAHLLTPKAQRRLRDAGFRAP